MLGKKDRSDNRGNLMVALSHGLGKKKAGAPKVIMAWTAIWAL